MNFTYYKDEQAVWLDRLLEYIIYRMYLGIILN